MYLRSSASCHGYAAGRDGDDDAINPLTNDSGADCYEGHCHMMSCDSQIPCESMEQDEDGIHDTMVSLVQSKEPKLRVGVAITNADHTPLPQ